MLVSLLSYLSGIAERDILFLVNHWNRSNFIFVQLSVGNKYLKYKKK
jgi:hypothetical protein